MYRSQSDPKSSDENLNVLTQSDQQRAKNKQKGIKSKSGIFGGIHNFPIHATCDCVFKLWVWPGAANVKLVTASLAGNALSLSLSLSLSTSLSTSLSLLKPPNGPICHQADPYVTKHPYFKWYIPPITADEPCLLTSKIKSELSPTRHGEYPP